MKHKKLSWDKNKTKCVVLCGGKGTRLLPATADKQKTMIEVAGKPILKQIIDYWSKYTNDFVFVVYYKKEEIINYVKTLPIRSEFVELDELKSLAHGLKSAEKLLPENFVAVLGDCLVKGDFHFPPGMKQGIGVWKTNVEDDIKKSYSVETDGMIARKLVEKPKKLINDLCGMGVYFFNRKIFDYIDKTQPSALKGEIELTDAIQNMAHGGETIHVISFNGHYININGSEDLKKAEELFGGSQ